jgi:hypothetical protein
MGLLGRLGSMMGRGGGGAMDNAAPQMMRPAMQSGGGMADDAAFQSFKITAASRLSQTNPQAAEAISQANSIEEINAILRQVAQASDPAYATRAAVTQQRNSPYGSY